MQSRELTVKVNYFFTLSNTGQRNSSSHLNRLAENNTEQRRKETAATEELSSICSAVVHARSVRAAAWRVAAADYAVRSDRARSSYHGIYGWACA